MNFSLDFLDKNLFLAFIFYFRIYDEVSSDIKKRRTSRSRKNDDTKLVGPAVFPVGLLKSEDRNISSQHPWACSLRTRGFRGRHRCGVTLLSGQYTTLQSAAESLAFIMMIKIRSSQAQQLTLLRTRLCWWEQLTVTTSVKTDTLATCWRPAAADLPMSLGLVLRGVF